MKKKYSFPEPQCRSCPKHRSLGNLICETRYCMGFPQKRNGKRFRASDPQYKPPKWCPRRLAIPVCRIYGFANEQSEMLDRERRYQDDPTEQEYAFPLEWHYKLRTELSLSLTAKQFWERVQQDTAESVLSDVNLDYGEVVEIDDGLKPYYFYYTYGVLMPVLYFDSSRTVKPEVRDEA